MPGPKSTGPSGGVYNRKTEFAEKGGKPLQRDSAPNRSLLEKVAAFDTILAVIKCSTHFFTGLLHHKEQATVSKVIRLCTPADPSVA